MENESTEESPQVGKSHPASTGGSTEYAGNNHVGTLESLPSNSTAVKNVKNIITWSIYPYHNVGNNASPLGLGHCNQDTAAQTGSKSSSYTTWNCTSRSILVGMWARPSGYVTEQQPNKNEEVKHAFKKVLLNKDYRFIYITRSSCIALPSGLAALPALTAFNHNWNDTMAQYLKTPVGRESTLLLQVIQVELRARIDEDFQAMTQVLQDLERKDRTWVYNFWSLDDRSSDPLPLSARAEEELRLWLTAMDAIDAIPLADRPLCAIQRHQRP